MKLFASVKPNAKENKVTQINDHHFKISVKAPAKDGKANQAVIELLSHYLDLPKNVFSLLSGTTRKSKVIKVKV